MDPSTGNVFVGDIGNQRIQVFDRTGNFITKFGTAGNGDGQFDVQRRCNELTTGNVYVTDSGNNRIQVFFLDP